jgi:cold-inducible RNA-binding protein
MELFVGNLPWSMTDQELQTLFSAHGSVQRATIVMDRESGRSRGFGFVTMGDEAAGNAAIKALNGQDSGGRAMTVRKAEPRAARTGGGGGGGGYGGGGDRGGRGGGGNRY